MMFFVCPTQSRYSQSLSNHCRTQVNLVQLLLTYARYSIDTPLSIRDRSGEKGTGT
jgi:hypothetical protein